MNTQGIRQQKLMFRSENERELTEHCGSQDNKHLHKGPNVLGIMINALFTYINSFPPLREVFCFTI